MSERTQIDPRDQVAVNAAVMAHIAVLDERTAMIAKTLNDNGQPGLVTRVARLEGASSKTTAKSGGLSALVAVAVAVVMHKLGVTG